MFQEEDSKQPWSNQIVRERGLHIESCFSPEQPQCGLPSNRPAIPFLQEHLPSSNTSFPLLLLPIRPHLQPWKSLLLLSLLNSGLSLRARRMSIRISHLQIPLPSTPTRVIRVVISILQLRKSWLGWGTRWCGVKEFMSTGRSRSPEKLL